MADSVKNLQPLYIDAISGKFITKNEQEPGLCGFQHVQHLQSSRWIVNHGRNFAIFLFSTFKNSSGKFIHIIPNKVEVISGNLLVVEFSESISGIMNLVYYSSDNTCVITPVTFFFGGINSFSINGAEINAYV